METFRSKTDTIIEVPQDWVALYIKENPEAVEILNTHKIYNDVSYLNAERGLSPITRQKLSIFRIRHLADKNRRDPCAIARAASPWWAKQRLTSANTTLRVYKVLQTKNIQTVEDLAAWTTEKLHEQTPFGYKTLYNLCIFLNKIIGDNPIADKKQTRDGDIDDALIRDAIAEPDKLKQLMKILHYADNCKDPCKLARLARPWLGKWKLIDTNFPKAPIEVMRRDGIETISDLATCSPEKLLGKRMFGRKSLHIILNCLNTALLGKLISDIDYPANVDSIPNSKVSMHLRLSFIENLRRFLSSLYPTDLYIFKHRTGFETTFQTIQKISDTCGKSVVYVTLSQAAMIKNFRNSLLGHIFRQKIIRLSEETDFPLSLDQIETTDLWFSGIHSHRTFFGNLIGAVNERGIRVVKIGNKYYLGSIEQLVWKRTVEAAKALLSSSVDKGWSETEAFLQVQKLLPDGAKQFKNLLWDHASDLCYFMTNPDGTRTLIDYGRGLHRTIKVILSESDSPMHYDEIIKAIKLKLGLNLTVLRVCAAANSVGFSFRKGLYGLDKHIPFSDRQIARICRAAESIVYADKAKKQWHCFEILSKLSEQADETFDKLDIRLLNIVLSKSRRLSYLNRMVWTTTEGYNKGEKRLDKTQAIIAMIKNTGHPLTVGEIRTRLQKVAGINKILHMPRHPSLVRIAPNVWDVNDKDVSNS